MTVDRVALVKEVFAEAINLPQGDARREFVIQRCGDDQELLQEVDSLLNEHEDASHDLLDHPCSPLAIDLAEIARSERTLSEADAMAWLPSNRMIGNNFRVESVIDFGGMGVVYRAQQQSPSRTVALKVMRTGPLSRAERRRFEKEAQILARLQHPNVAQVFDAGVHFAGSVRDSRLGIPYFTMELIDGATPITTYAESESLSTRDRLRLFEDACQGVQHGHQRGIIHRDIKPANILVDREGQVKVIDFGVAKLTDSDIVVTGTATSVGQLVGTIQYMSPEQCGGHSHDIDVRSDVYSLGLVLYELLAGNSPFDIGRTSVANAVATVQRAAHRSITTYHRKLADDLVTIVHKAIEKDPERRYQSVNDLVDDISRFLRREPIKARPPSRIYIAAKFVERHPWETTAAVAGIVVVLTATVALAIGSLWIKARTTASIADARAEGARNNAVLAAIAEHDIGTAVQLRNRTPERYRLWEWEHLGTRLDLSYATLGNESTEASAGTVQQIAIDPNGEWIATCAERASEVVFWGTGSCDRQWTWQSSNSNPLFKVVAAPSSDLVAVVLHNLGSEQWEVVFVDIESRYERGRLQLDASGVGDVAFAGSSPLLLALAPSDQAMQLWDVETIVHEREVSSSSPRGALIGTLDGHRWHPMDLSYCDTKDRKLLASVGYDWVTRIWDITDPANGRCVALLRGHEDYGQGLSFNANGSLLATACLDGTVRIWDVEKSIAEYSTNGESKSRGVEINILNAHVGGVHDVEFSPSDLSLLASCGSDNLVKIWRIEEPTPLLEKVPRKRPDGDVSPVLIRTGLTRIRTRLVASLWGHRQAVRTVRFDPNGGNWIASGSKDGTVKLWHTRQLDPTPTMLGHRSTVHKVTFTPDGRYAISIAHDGTFRTWDVETTAPLATVDIDQDGGSAVYGVSVHPSKPIVAIACADGAIRTWDIGSLAHPEALQVIEAHDGNARHIEFSPDGSKALSTGVDGRILIWDLLFGTAISETTWNGAAELRHDRPVPIARFSPDARFVYAAVGARYDSDRLSNSARLVIWDLDRGVQSCSIDQRRNGGITDLCISPDGRLLAMCHLNGTATLWDIENPRSPELLHILEGHTAELEAVAFHPTQPRLATSSRDRTIKVWDTRTGTEMLTLRGHLEAVTDVAFSPDGSRLASTCTGQQGRDTSVRFWETTWDPEQANRRAIARDRYLKEMRDARTFDEVPPLDVVGP